MVHCSCSICKDILRMVVIPKTGEVPTGFAPQIGPQGVTAAPIPGTPQAQKLREQLEELQKQVKDLEHAAASNAEAEQEPAAKK